MIFRQLFEPESSTYTYLLADEDTKDAVLIDPVRETLDRDLQLLKELGLKLKYVLDTHLHADHVTAAGPLRDRTGAQTGVSRHAHVDCADLPLEDGQEIIFGRHRLRVIETPGHTNSCLSFYGEGRVFTGDALLIRGTGRTDFQQGSSARLFQSVTEKLFRLPAETLVFPAHDYRGQTVTTIGEERAHNPRLGGGRSEAEFSRIMSELKLAHPKKIDEALPANQACGQKKESKMQSNSLTCQLVDGVPTLTAEDLKPQLGQVRLIDVRRPDEFNNELGHIPGAELVTLGPDLAQFLEKGSRDQQIVFVCRSGGRSGQATAQSRTLGYQKTLNLAGGMLRWNELKFPTEKN